MKKATKPAAATKTAPKALTVNPAARPQPRQPSAQPLLKTGWWVALTLKPDVAPRRCYGGQIEALTADGVRITPLDYLTGRADGFDIYVPHRNIESALVCTDAHHRQLFDEQFNRWQSSMEPADRQPLAQAAEATQPPAQEPAEPPFKTLGESIAGATKDG